jgi:hypothetical protein
MITMRLVDQNFPRVVFISIAFLVLSSSSQAQQGSTQTPPTSAEQQQELLDFPAIRSILQSDDLDQSATKTEVKVERQRTQRQEQNRNLFNIPGNDVFWTFMSEYWIVKNAPILRFDFSKPDYGIAPAFSSFLEQMGIYEQGFKILLINSPMVPHFALPSNPRGDVLFILSVPFIRTLDLSRQEISLLLFENLLRHRQGYFQNMLMTPELEKFIGSNFEGAALDKSMIENLFKQYDKIIYEQGFQFQQQFEITRLMDQHLKNDLPVWNTYYNLIRKIDELVKSNTLYQRYNVIYPSTELQLNWLRPRQTAL